MPEKLAVDLDNTAAGWVQAYRQAEQHEREWAAVKARAREHLEAILGDAEVGLVDDTPAVRWTYVTSRRLDQRKLKEHAPDLVEQCTVDSVTRRFTVAEDGVATAVPTTTSEG